MQPIRREFGESRRCVHSPARVLITLNVQCQQQERTRRVKEGQQDACNGVVSLSSELLWNNRPSSAFISSAAMQMLCRCNDAYVTLYIILWWKRYLSDTSISEDC
jgi:hypothetical protein